MAQVDRFRTEINEIADVQVKAVVPDAAWARWAARLAPAVAIEAVIA